MSATVAQARRGWFPGSVLRTTRDQSHHATRLGGPLADYLAWKRLDGAADRTLDQYERDIRTACHMFDVEPEAWTSAMVMHVVSSFPQGSHKRVRAALNDYFRYLVRWGHIAENPVDRVPKGKPRAQAIIDVFTDAEEQALKSLPVRDGALTTILLDGGLRKGEATGLLGKHVDFANGELRVFQGKGNKDRLVPLGTASLMRIAELFTLEGIGPDDHLWYSTRVQSGVTTVFRSKPVGAGTFHRWWCRCMVEAGIVSAPPGNRRLPEWFAAVAADDRYRNPHVARHTYATKYLRAGGRMETLARILGHASVSTTDHYYAHLSTRDLHDDLARVLEARGR